MESGGGFPLRGTRISKAGDVGEKGVTTGKIPGRCVERAVLSKQCHCGANLREGTHLGSRCSNYGLPRPRLRHLPAESLEKGGVSKGGPRQSIHARWCDSGLHGSLEFSMRMCGPTCEREDLSGFGK
ncbi:hypothetical protein CEXT_739791 [Caerostris extrusa]|uniref:Uncharacterized protein n=1 Tax=Caerostris extrusa TaxID=172846 RepID=A0AAV4U8Q4_CAEEX|nr:hypothetical protein CEXT_739791 [Caerostris extrusa]